MTPEAYWMWNALENINFWHERWKEQRIYIYDLHCDRDRMEKERYDLLLESAKAVDNYCYAKFKHLLLILYPIWVLERHNEKIPVIDLIEFPYHPFQDTRGIVFAIKKCNEK